MNELALGNKSKTTSKKDWAKEEIERLKSLDQYNIHDLTSEEEDALSNLTKLAAQICDVPYALVNFLDKDTQWTKSSFGIDVEQMPRETSFCQYTIKRDDFMVVEDATMDERLMHNEFVTDEPGLRFYAGANIKSKTNRNLGSICVLDTKQKKLSQFQLDALQTLAREVESRLELRRKNRQLEQAAIFLQNSTDIMFILNRESMNIEYVNDEIEKFFGFSKKEITGQSFDVLSPSKKFMEAFNSWKEKQDATLFLNECTFKTSEGLKIDLSVSISESGGKWYVTARDISKRRIAERKLKKEKEISERIINSLPVNFFMFNSDREIVRWNESFRKTSGYKDEEIRQLRPVDYFSDDEALRIDTYFDKTIEGQDDTMEADLIDKKGNKTPYLFNLTTVEVGKERFLMGTGQDISGQKKNQQRLEELLGQKVTLLAEIHHRVKNNLAVISGLLQLQQYRIDSEAAKIALRSSQMRIQSMAMIHESLYESTNFSNVKFDKYVDKLLGSIESTLKNPDREVELEIDIEDVALNINQAIPLALIINELVTNSYKYAFPDNENGKIKVSLTAESDVVILKVSDNGIGLPEGVSIENSASLGFTLVSNLSRQIDSEIEVNSNQGLEIGFKFQKKAVAGSSSAFKLTG